MLPISSKNVGFICFKYLISIKLIMQLLFGLLSCNAPTLFIIFFSYLLLRYFVLSFFVYWVMWVVGPNFFDSRRLNSGHFPRGQISQEIKNSCISFFAISFYAVLVTELVIKTGYSRFYTDWNQYPLWWPIVSFFAVFLLHDTYFYFCHRFLHLPWLFKNVHSVHHKSKITNPCSSYSFHWLEALLQVLYTLPLILFLPMHPVFFIGLMAFTHLTVTSGHSGFDILPKNIWNSPFFSWITTATHHSHHHLYNNENYGLVIKSWDRLFNTMSPHTDRHYKSEDALGPVNSDRPLST